MRCQTCDYVLWNLPARQCPECGTAFRPSEFEFAPNTVQFCCPFCEQDYFGTDQQGHLVPREFTCVRCQRPVRMDDMILRPGEGMEDHQTMADANPWLEREHRGWVKSWFKTVGWALVSPGRLMRATPPHSSLKTAMWFALVSGVMPVAVIAVPLILILMFVVGVAGPQGGGPGPATIMGIMGGSVAAALVIGVVGIFIYLGIWGLVTHGLLRLGGTLDHGLGRTYQALFYSAGTNALNALIFCGGHYASSIWWLVSATIMVKEGHQVSGLRASFAVLTGPIAAVVIFLVGYGLFVAVMLSGTGPFSTTWSSGATQSITTGIISHAGQNNGVGPDHALSLITDDGFSGDELLDDFSDTFESDVPLGSGTLADVSTMNTTEKATLLQASVDALPDNVIAHRLGDFVFTYHGLDLTNPDPGLWVVILSWDPDATLSGSSQITVPVGLADGTVISFPYADLATIQLPQQNALRAASGLPPLPDPATVTHDQPAVDSP